jgi:hypothetical protein
MLQGPVDHLPDGRRGEVLDVFVPGAIEGAAEQETPVVVEQHPLKFMQGANLLERLGGFGVHLVAGEVLAQRLFVTGQDL